MSSLIGARLEIRRSADGVGRGRRRCYANAHGFDDLDRRRRRKGANSPPGLTPGRARRESIQSCGNAPPIPEISPMSVSNATLHMMCGKIAAGKSTLSAKLGQVEKTLVISEDRWISQLYGPELLTLADFFVCCDRLRATLAPHIVEILRAGVSVALDFHANTVVSRQWMRTLFEEAQASHQLHFLDVPDEICRARMHARKAAGGDGVSDAEFDHVTSFFVPPAPSEGFSVIRYCDGF
jgi:predicted kinase